MFTLTIGGKAVAVTNADEAEARELFMSEDFKDDLRNLESEGAPLWDGAATLEVRAATEDESAEFEDAEFDEDDEEEDDGPFIMFIVDVSDPDEEEEDGEA